MNDQFILKVLNSIEDAAKFIIEHNIATNYDYYEECYFYILSSKLYVCINWECICISYEEQIGNHNNLVAYINWNTDQDDFISGVKTLICINHTKDIIYEQLGRSTIEEFYNIPETESDVFNLRTVMNVPSLEVLQKYKEIKANLPCSFDILTKSN